MSVVNHPKAPSGTFRSLAREMPPLEIDEPLPLAERLQLRKLSVGAPSKPVLGLPLARLIPQDMHSMMDYANGLAAASTTFATDDKAAQLASIVLATTIIGASAITDYRLSVAKLLPIEAHEVADYVWGATAIAAPFMLGYWKSSPKVAIAHVAAGIGTIISSLVTDYRAYSQRSKTTAR
jgi:hypothetical protein